MTLLFVYLAIAIGVSFICSVLEAVLLSITPSHIERLRTERPRMAAMMSRVCVQRLDESLSSILILNTFAHTMGAAGVGSQALQVFGAKWETLIAVLLTLAILYFSEIIPKTLGATFWRPLALPAVGLIRWLVRLVYPLVWLATRLTRLFSRNRKEPVSREEIIAMASLGQKGGTLKSQEIEYLANVLNLRNITTGEVLTPRTVVHMLDETMTVGEALQDPKTRCFSRIPLYRDSFDKVTGKVLRVDLYEAERAGKGKSLLKEFGKPVIRVSKHYPVRELLDRFIKTRAHIFLVLDDYGQVAGIVTLEDAIETLLGREIVDESDFAVDMQELARGKYRDRLRKASPEQTEPKR